MLNNVAWRKRGETAFHVESLDDAFMTACGIELLDDVYSDESAWKLVRLSRISELTLCTACRHNYAAVADIPMGVQNDG